MAVIAIAGCDRVASDERERPKGVPTARLELKVVDEGDERSMAVYARAIEEIKKEHSLADEYRIEEQCLTTAAGLGVRIAGWEHEPGGKRFHDWHVTARDRATLEAFLAAFPPGEDHEWGFERGEWPCGRSREPTPMWSSYYHFRAAELTGASVTGASVKENGYTGRPEVEVTFDGEGKRRFAELTEKMAGHKLAILVDGVVTSAPVIMERIDGGRMRLVMGPGTPDELEKGAEALAAALDPR